MDTFQIGLIAPIEAGVVKLLSIREGGKRRQAHVHADDLARRAAATSHEKQTNHLPVRDGLLQMRQQARTQRHALGQWPVIIAGALEALDTVITELDTQLQALDTAIRAVLCEGAWADSATLLACIPGIGLLTTAWLLVGTLNFTACASAESAAAYAGLVPMARESGTSVRGRAQIGHGGHARLRTALYMATLTAARFNPVIRVQYERLRAAGKPSKVARCAAARKLIHLAFAVVTKQHPFDPSSHATSTGVVADAA